MFWGLFPICHPQAGAQISRQSQQPIKGGLRKRVGFLVEGNANKKHSRCCGLLNIRKDPTEWWRHRDGWINATPTSDPDSESKIMWVAPSLGNNKVRDRRSPSTLNTRISAASSIFRGCKTMCGRVGRGCEVRHWLTGLAWADPSGQAC